MVVKKRKNWYIDPCKPKIKLWYNEPVYPKIKIFYGEPCDWNEKCHIPYKIDKKKIEEILTS